MEKKFKVELARPVFETITNYGVYSPIQLDNACRLVGVDTQTHTKQNQFLMYFMLRDAVEIYDRNAIPTEVEVLQMEYIKSHMNENILNYIDALDKDEQKFNPNSIDGLNNLFDFDSTESSIDSGGPAVSNTVKVDKRSKAYKQSHKE